MVLSGNDYHRAKEIEEQKVEEGRNENQLKQLCEDNRKERMHIIFADI